MYTLIFTTLDEDSFTASIDLGGFTTLIANVHLSPQGVWYIETPDGPVYSAGGFVSARKKCVELARQAARALAA